ncbi:MAG: hypothetical protein PHQ75_14540 [Thermoguttaceae bacterium]|nr:hypothetical protein [Thermoguttaceae bacterium]
MHDTHTFYSFGLRVPVVGVRDIPENVRTQAPRLDGTGGEKTNGANNHRRSHTISRFGMIWRAHTLRDRNGMKGECVTTIFRLGKKINDPAVHHCVDYSFF